MKNLFEYAQCCLHHSDIEEKLTVTHLAWQQLQSGELSLASHTPVAAISLTQFPTQPQLLPPREMPRRRLNSPGGVAAMFHALAHIEFVAIYLAWDILYRFRDLPTQFYHDWLKVADEEAQHFALIQSHLRSLGVDYGDLPAHQGLWEHATDTADNLLARLAIVPRCMEARGLDVTPTMIEKFKTRNDETSVAILTRILTDEVGHVAIGSYWFKYFCQQQGLEAEQTYRDLLQQFYKGKPKGPFNKEMRIIAGFSTAELDWLETNEQTTDF
jgi:uncharacterized ferritin-like protein (DUF455 family)